MWDTEIEHCDGTDAVAMVSLYEDADDRCYFIALANKKYEYYYLQLPNMNWTMGNPECIISLSYTISDFILWIQWISKVNFKKM